MRISDWSSDVCSSDLNRADVLEVVAEVEALLDFIIGQQRRYFGVGFQQFHQRPFPVRIPHLRRVALDEAIGSLSAGPRSGIRQKHPLRVSEASHWAEFLLHPTGIYEPIVQHASQVCRGEVSRTTPSGDCSTLTECVAD